jgi:hypothetical protein
MLASAFKFKKLSVTLHPCLKNTFLITKFYFYANKNEITTSW